MTVLGSPNFDKGGSKMWSGLQVGQCMVIASLVASELWKSV
jgi:hypothetical protein